MLLDSSTIQQILSKYFVLRRVDIYIGTSFICFISGMMRLSFYCLRTVFLWCFLLSGRVSAEKLNTKMKLTFGISRKFNQA